MQHPTSECSCPMPGECTRFRMRMTGRLYDICRGSVLTQEECQEYRRLWDNQANGRPHVSLQDRKREVCIHRGQMTGRRLCPTCSGHVELSVFNCPEHNECTVAKSIVGVACCKTCDEYTSTEKSLTWAYGVTTVPSRRDDLLPRTLKSLQAAGFGSPRLFVDGESDLSRYIHFGLDVTLRYPKVNVASNWTMSILELFHRDPNADFYAIFQDDMVAPLNLREYLENIRYPERGYCNLNTFPENQKLCGIDPGWYESNQKGKSAVALVFSNEAVSVLLSSRHFVDRVKNPDRGWRLIDGGVVESMSRAGWKEYVHHPSLIQHTGTISSISKWKCEHPQDISFPGENYDCLTLLNRLPITAVIPIAGECSDLVTSCLKALVQDIRYVPLQKICVIANGVSDAVLETTREALDAIDINTKIIVNSENEGFTRAVNTGIRSSGKSHVLILNSDCRLAPNALRCLYKTVSDGAAAVNPLTMDRGVCSLRCPGRLSESRLSEIPEEPVDLLRVSCDLKSEKTSTENILPFYCTLISHSAIQEVGFLNEEFESGLGADDEWCLRAKKLGLDLRLHYGAFADHDGGQTFRMLGLNRMIMSAAAMQQYRRAEKLIR